MAELKHVGRIKSTNKKCFVVYRTLPGASDYSLVVIAESLPDQWYDSINSLLNSSPAQNAIEFADSLNRSVFINGGNMLHDLHHNNKLTRWKTDDVEMIPSLNVQPILLSELNQLIAKNLGIAVDELCMRGERDKQVRKIQDEQPTTETKPTIEQPISPDALRLQAKELMDKVNDMLKVADALESDEKKVMVESDEKKSNTRVKKPRLNALGKEVGKQSEQIVSSITSMNSGGSVITGVGNY